MIELQYLSPFLPARASKQGNVIGSVRYISIYNSMVSCGIRD